MTSIDAFPSPKEFFGRADFADMMSFADIPDDLAITAKLAHIAMTEGHLDAIARNAVHQLLVRLIDGRMTRLLMYLLGCRSVNSISPEAWSWVFGFAWRNYYLRNSFTYPELETMFVLTVPEHLMTAGERAFLEATPDEFEVFRGTAASETPAEAQQGMSWTRDEAFARWHAIKNVAPAAAGLDGPGPNGIECNPLLLRAVARRSDVLAYFLFPRRGEFVLPPGAAKVAEVSSISAPKGNAVLDDAGLLDLEVGPLAA